MVVVSFESESNLTGGSSTRPRRRQVEHDAGERGAGNRRRACVLVGMDEQEFRSMLELFPVVRSRDYCKADLESSSKGTTEQTRAKETKRATKEPSSAEDLFLRKLKLVAEKKVGAAKAELFCKTFEEAHDKLVYKELNLDAAQRFLNTYKSSYRCDFSY